MTFIRQEDPPPDAVHRLPGSPLRFRGAVPSEGPFLAVLGSSEVAGRYAPEAFTTALADRLGLPVANLGVHNGGVDVFLQDDAVLAAAARGTASVVQVMGAHALSNRLYTVHPRRNDRFLRHAGMLATLYRDVDFTEFSFARHMLTELKRAAPQRFVLVRKELEAAWVARMRLLLARLPEPRAVLWLHGPGAGELGREPLFVTRTMVERVAPLADTVVEVDVTGHVGADDATGMRIPAGSAAAAERMLNPAGHAAVADALGGALAALGVRAGRAAA